MTVNLDDTTVIVIVTVTYHDIIAFTDSVLNLCRFVLYCIKASRITCYIVLCVFIFLCCAVLCLKLIEGRHDMNKAHRVYRVVLNHVVYNCSVFM
jgi:uncharacterized membrane protein